MGVPITGTLTTYAGGVYPTHNDQLGWGGCRVVATHTARNAIPTISSRLGMLVITQADAPGIIWQLTTYPPTGADGDWTQVPTGSVSFPISIADGGTGENTATLGFDALSPLTTTGDTLCFGATHNVRVAGNITTAKQFFTQTGGGASSNVPAWEAIAGTDLPNPSASSLGGIQSAAGVSHQWIASISTSGVPSLSQPAFTDISGVATVAQLPTVGLIITQHAGDDHHRHRTSDAVTVNLATSDWHLICFDRQHHDVHALESERRPAVHDRFPASGQRRTLLGASYGSLARSFGWVAVHRVDADNSVGLYDLHVRYLGVSGLVVGQ